MASTRQPSAQTSAPSKQIMSEIKSEAALSSTYTRGASLARNGAVHECRAYEKDGLVSLAARVKGSRSYYGVTVGLDTRTSTVRSYSCDCPAFAKYEGMCKHEVAVALTYLAHVGTAAGVVPRPAPMERVDSAPGVPEVPTVMEEPPTRAGSRPSSGERAAAPSSRGKAARKRVPPTSPQISALINTYADQMLAETRRVAQVAPDAVIPDEEPVELVCVVRSADAAWRYSWSQDTWALSLKVVRGKVSYVVKSISDLVDAWHEGATVSYGKNLSFNHRPESFSKRANSLLELLSGVVEAQQSLYAAQENRSYSYSSYDYQRRMSDKILPLSTAQLLEVLRIEVGTKITFETTDGGSRYYGTTTRTLAVREEDPRPKVQIARTEDVWELTVEPADAIALGDERGLALVVGRVLYLCGESFAHDLGVFFDALLPLRSPLHIRDADMSGFCSAVLPALRTHVELDAPDDLDDFMPPQAELAFRIGLEEGIISCKATATYGEVSLPLYADVYKRQPVRDVERELVAQRLLRTYFPFGDHDTPNYGAPYEGAPGKPGFRRGPYGAYLTQVDPWFDKDDDEAYYLLFAQGLQDLSEMGEVYLSERLRDVSVRQAPAVRVDASVSGGLLDIAVSSDDMEPAELMAYLASWRRRQRFVRLESGDIVRLDGSIATIEGLAEGLGVSADQLVSGIDALPANRTLFVDAMLKRAEGVSFSRNAAFRQIVRDFETVADADFVVPDSVRAQLRPYQRDGFRWLCTLGKVGFGGILADDMGLGKTLQAIAYLARYRADAGEGSATSLGGDGAAPIGEGSPVPAGTDGATAAAIEGSPGMGFPGAGESLPAHLPSLVVCPASLVYNWASELERFCPELELSVVAGAKRERTSAIAAAPDFDVLITSYDLMKRDVEAYVGQRFHAVILDEAHYIKNANTLVARSAKRLPSEVRFALTGTPIENRLSELWSIFDFLMPGVLGSHESFAKRFSTPISSGDEAAAERLRRLVSPFVLRRLKGDVLRDLPDKSENLVASSLEGEQGKLYRAHAQRLRMQVERQLPEEFAGMRLQILAELTKLRQICCDPSLVFEDYRGGSAKLDTCMELVASAIEGGHQMLIFSQFTSMLDLIAARLEDEGVGYLMLTGSTSKEQRQRLVARFQAGERPVFLISLKAGGVGLNLTAADIVIHYDPWWNVAAEDQATDRAHRIGQTRAVSVFKLIAQDTIEERIVEMQQAKRALADAVIGGEGIGSGAITRDDILALLEG